MTSSMVHTLAGDGGITSVMTSTKRVSAIATFQQVAFTSVTGDIRNCQGPYTFSEYVFKSKSTCIHV